MNTGDRTYGNAVGVIPDPETVGISVAVWGDVLDNEKIQAKAPKQKEIFDQLTALPHVLITPHVAGWTFESYKKINDVLRDKIKRYLAI